MFVLQGAKSPLVDEVLSLGFGVGTGVGAGVDSGFGAAVLIATPLLQTSLPFFFVQVKDLFA